MSINIGPASSDELRPKITVIGVGGAGGNAIANMQAAEIEGVDFIVANTDAQALSNASAERRIQLGPDITGGLGAGARPEVGKAAAEETVEEIEEALDGVNMVFIAAGMGGGTGTGAAPVIAEAARRRGVLTVGVVTKPFLFEGSRRMRAAEAGIEELQRHVDTLIVIPNQNLFLVAKAETTFKEAFELADEVLQQGVRSITDLMVMPGLINLDFADVRSVMSEMGKAMMGTGEGEGENRALEAAEHAIANPLLDGVSMAGAKGVIISIIGGEDMKLLEVDEAANHIRELVDDDANIIWGSAFNPELDGRIRVSVVATGIDTSASSSLSSTSTTSRGFSLSEARAPQRPAIDLPRETPVDEEPFELNEGLSAEPEPARDDMSSVGGMSAYDTSMSDEPEEPMELTSAQYVEGEDENAESGGINFDMSYDDEEEVEDVDGIVDPLAGLRNDHDSFDRDDGLTPPTDDRAHSSGENAGGWSSENVSIGRDPYDQSGSNGDGDSSAGGGYVTSQPASPLASKPARDGDAGHKGAGLAGATLFERMANLSRGSSANGDDKSDDDDDDDGALNIPRFLGRQNNQ